MRERTKNRGLDCLRRTATSAVLICAVGAGHSGGGARAEEARARSEAVSPRVEGGKGFVLAALPYSEKALAPTISERTMGFHHGKHHKGYVDKLNELLKGSPLGGQPLEAILKGSFDKPDQQALFNSAAQVWNHDFYWKSLRPGGGGRPKGELMKKITEDFGSFDRLKQALIDAASAQFGSGWVWLVLDGGHLKVVKTSNADTPLVHDQKPLLTIDVWEHAYYLDYQNRRADHAKAVIEKLLNWDWAEGRVAA